VLAYVFVWLFVFAVPWQDVLVIPGLGTASKLLGIAAVGATLLRVMLRGRVRPMISFHLVAFLLMAWISLSAFWSVARQESVIIDLKTYLQLFVMVWAIWESTPTRNRLVSLMEAFVLGAYVAAGSTIYNYLTGGTSARDVTRFAATGFDPNDIGMVMALALPMAWYLASQPTNVLLRWLNRGYFVVGTLGILLTSSRGAMLVAIVGLLAIPWTLTQVRGGLRLATVVIVLGAAVASVRLVPQQSFERLSTTRSELEEGTLNDRLKIWKGGIAAVPERPIQGYGLAGWYSAVDHRIGNHAPHNSFLAILVEEGLIGLCLYVAIFALLLPRLLLLPTFERRISLTMYATLVMANLPLGWNQNKASWLVIALLAAFPEVVVRERPIRELARVGTLEHYRPLSRRAGAAHLQ
jgi:O-antigen ligase